MNYIIGLDVGIGSVGWSVIRADENCKRIEDFDVRTFDGGEDKKERKSNCQKRRGFRGPRRQIRRKKHRKDRLKYFLSEISFVTEQEMRDYYGKKYQNVIDLRVKGLDERLTPQELTACLVHICKFRGYKPFYDLDESDAKKEEGELIDYMNNTNKVILDGNYRSVAEAIQKDPYFKEKISGRYRFHNKNKQEKKKTSDNKKSKDEKSLENENQILFSNSMIREEADNILHCQQKYYSQLGEENIEKILSIIFSRRDFEDGPGNPNDTHRKYTGFYDSIGKCRFYKDKNRGCRFTVLGDVFALINKLSQFKYVSIETGEVDRMPHELITTIIMSALEEASLTKNKIIKIAKKKGFTLVSSNETKDDNKDITNCLKFVKPMKKIFETEDIDFDWKKLICEDPTDTESLLNRIGYAISYNITPYRRIKKLNSIPEIKGKEIVDKLSRVKLSGTSSVSNEYMIDAINAFRNGKLYGEFQAEVIKANYATNVQSKKYKKLKPFTKDSEIYNNPVVFRSVNECRKVVNAIVARYGLPSAMNIEVASDLNRSFKKRDDIKKIQQKRQKANETALETVAKLLDVDESEVTSSQLLRYKLAEQQGWRSLYSGKLLYANSKNKIEDKDKKAIILNTDKIYEVDHIVPFSRILDDSLNNKVLVFAEENQTKSNRTPLMYLEGEERKEFIKRVNYLYQSSKENKKGAISKIKYSYLMLDSLTSEEALRYLDEWKSRNLNDTRYIAKFLVKYFNDNLLFANNKDSRRPPVYAVKGAITSMLRRQWLNKATWGMKDKNKLKEVTNLDHAVDAIVIGNCLPAYVEIAVENAKLRDIYYSSNKKKTDEYYNSKNTFIENLWKFYGIPKSESSALLGKMTETPSLIKNLRQEVECRVRDYGTMKFFSKSEEVKTKEELDEIFRKDLAKFYVGQEDFVKSISMPIVSRKQERRFRGEIANSKFIKSSKQVTSVYKKEIDEDNFAYIDDRKYYCVEVYQNEKGKTCATALKYNNIVKYKGKLYLKHDYKYPDGYKKHLMYLFPGDYIKVKNSSTEEFSGYYSSVYYARSKQIYVLECRDQGENCNVSKEAIITIKQNAVVKKYNVDILGKLGREITKCGEPLSYLPEKN